MFNGRVKTAKVTLYQPRAVLAALLLLRKKDMYNHTYPNPTRFYRPFLDVTFKRGGCDVKGPGVEVRDVPECYEMHYDHRQ